MCKCAKEHCRLSVNNLQVLSQGHHQHSPFQNQISSAHACVSCCMRGWCGVQVVGLGWSVWLVVIVFVLLAGVIGKSPPHCYPGLRADAMTV